MLYSSSFPRCAQTSCLASGLEAPLRGGIELRDKTVLGWVSSAVPVSIQLNGQVIASIGVAQLMEQPDGRIGFQKELSDEENGPGLKLFRVYGMVENVCKFLVFFFAFMPVAI